MVEQLEQRMLLAGTITARTPAWVEQGPAPLTDSNLVKLPPFDESNGAVEAIAASSKFSQIAFISTVNGGVWRSGDVNTVNPHWEPLTDGLRSLSMGSIAMSPISSDGTTRIDSLPFGTSTADVMNQLVVYAGFAQTSSGASDGGAALGLIFSAKGGKAGTWHYLASDQLKGLQVRAIVPSQTSPWVVYAAASGDGPNTGVWKITIKDGTSKNPTAKVEHVLTGNATDLVGVPGSADVLYAARPGFGVFRSVDGKGGGWTNSGLTGRAQRIVLASSAHSVFAAVIGLNTAGNTVLTRVSWWDDATSTWKDFSKLPTVQPTPWNLSLSLAADPLDSHVVFIGGNVAPGTVVGNVERGDFTKSNPWESVVLTGAQGGGRPTAPHSDSRDMTFDANNDLLETSDGGVFKLRLPDSSSTDRFWATRDGDLSVAEFVSIGFDSSTSSLFGGLQDNGVVEQPVGGTSKRWPSVPTGDGNIVDIYNGEETINSTRFISGANLSHLQSRVIDLSGNPIVTPLPLTVIGSGGRKVNGPGIQAQGTNLVFDNSIIWNTPFVVSKVNGKRLLVGTHTLYESFDGGKTVTAINGLDKTRATDSRNDDGDAVTGPDPDEVEPNRFGNGGTISALAYGAKDNSEVAWVGQGRDLWYREDRNFKDQRDFTQITGYTGGFIRDIALDADDSHIAYIIDNQGSVFRVDQTAGTSTPITGDLGPTVTGLRGRTADLRSIEVIKTGRTDVSTIVLVGGLGGVYATLDQIDGNHARWSRVGSGLPRGIVKDVRYDHSRSNDVLYCGTWGRGAWKITGFLAKFLPAAKRPEPGVVPLVLNSTVSSAPAWAPDAKFQGPLTSLEYLALHSKFVGPLQLDLAISPLALTTGDPGVLEITGDALTDKNDTIRLVLEDANPDILDVYVDNNTDEPDFSIEADSIQKVIVTGGEGDDTLLIDNSNGLVRFAEGIDFDQSGPGTNVKREINQTPISSGIVAKIKSGLASLAEWSKKLADFAQIAQKLPGLNKSIADTLAVGDGSLPIAGAIKKGLIDPLNTFLTNEASPSVQKLVDFLRSLGAPVGNVFFGLDPLSVSGGIFSNASGGQDLRIDLTLHLKGFAGELPLDFSAAVESLGLKFSSSGKVNLNTSLDLSFSFGVDLRDGLSDAQAFFIRVNDLSASAHVSAGEISTAENDPVIEDSGAGVGGPDGQEDDEESTTEEEGGGASDVITGEPIDVNVSFGFLDASIHDGSVKLDATLHIDVENPDNDADGHITMEELQGTSISELLNVEVEGDLKAHLPVLVSLAGVESSGHPAINITSDDLFGSVPEVRTEDFDQLLGFSKFTSADFLTLLKQVIAGLNTFRSSSVFNVEVPFTDTTLGDVLDFGTALTNKIITPLTNPDGSPKFHGAADFGILLAEALGLDPGLLDAHFDPETNQLTYHIAMSDTLATKPVNLKLDAGIKNIASLQAMTTLNLEASVAADFIVGIDVSPLASGETLADKFFINNASLRGTARIAADDIQAKAQLGFVGIGLGTGSEKGHGELLASASVDLVNPAAARIAAAAAPESGSEGRKISLKTLIDTVASNPSALFGPPKTVTQNVGANQNVSKTPGNQAEPAIAINPTNPNRVVVASNQDQVKGGIALSIRSDSGTWAQKLVGTGPAPDGDTFPFGCCDPSVAYDARGNLYVSYLSSDHTKVVVLKSADNGDTFTLMQSFSGNDLDRTALATGPSGIAGVESVWLVYRENQGANAGIFAAGATIGDDVMDLSPAGPFAVPRLVPSSISGSFPNIAVGPRGEAVVVFQDADISTKDGPTNLHLAIDPDGLRADGGNPSKPFNTPAALVTNTEVGSKEVIPPQPERAITSGAGIAYDMSALHHGRLYMVYTDHPKDHPEDTDIYVRFSDQNGAQGSWSKRIKVNTDAAGHSQFLPAIAVDPKTGFVAVTWYDTRNDGTANRKVEYFGAISINGGTSFRPDFKISGGQSLENNAEPPLNETKDQDFGDYSAVAYYGGTIYPAWADNSNSTSDNPLEGTSRRFDIYTSKIDVSAVFSRPAPGPSLVATELSGSSVEFAGSLDLVLPVSIDAGISIPLGTHPAVEVHWNDLTKAFDPATDIVFPDLENALNFSDMSFSDILGALRKVVDYLTTLRGFGFLGAKMPLLNASVGDLLDYASEFDQKLEQLQNDPVNSLQQVAGFIETEFGLDPGTVILSLDGKNLETKFSFSKHLSAEHSLNLDLASLLAKASGPVAKLGSILNISGDAKLLLSADVALNLDLGIDLSDPTDPTPFLYDGPGRTSFTIDGGIDTPLNLTLALGPLSAQIIGGNAHLGSAGGQKLFNIELNDDDANGKHYFDELTSPTADDINVALNAAADVKLPIYFLGEHLTPDLEVKVDDIAQFLTDQTTVQVVSAPDDLLSKLNINFSDNLAGIVQGFDQLLALLQTALDSKAFNRNLPLVGTHLKDGGQVIQAFRNEIIAPIKTAVDADKSIEGVRTAMFNVLNSLGVLAEHDGSPGISKDDIEIVKTGDPTNPDDVKFNFHLHKNAAATSFQPNIDIGLPALQLKVNGQANVSMGFDFNVGLGLNKGLGAYLDTSSMNELKLDFGIGIAGLHATGNLAFLQLDVDGLADGPSHINGLSGDFTVDLSAPGNKLAANSFDAASISARIKADADINLGLKVSFGGSVDFPSLSSQMHLTWGFDNNTTDSSFGSAPHVSFENIGLEVGSFLNRFARPLLNKIQTVLDPLQPLIDLLDTDLPMLAKIKSVRNFFDLNGDGHVFVREVAQKLDPHPVFDLIAAVDALKELVNSIPAGSSTVVIPLGRFDLNNIADLRQLDNLEGVSLTNFSESANVTSDLNAQAPGFVTALNKKELGGTGGVSGGKVEFPIFQHPAQAFKLLLGQDVDLFRWDLPHFGLNLSIVKEFPVLGPIVIRFAGAVGLDAHLGFAFDTLGLRQWRQGGGLNAVKSGFYLIDKPEGATTDPAEIHATGSISIGAGLNILVASASINGGIQGTLDLNLHDPDGDGKVRGGELADALGLGPLCVFDISGGLDAFLSAHASAGVWPLETSFDYEFKRVNLLHFDHECKDAPVPDPILAEDLGNGLLALNMGARAPKRLTVNTTDGDEAFTVGPDPNVPGNVLVTALGFSQSFGASTKSPGGITNIFGDGGDGNDSISIDPALNVKALLGGGIGNDSLIAGSGSSTLSGGGGDDFITGGKGDDCLAGQGGNDVINGGEGNDDISGNADDDQLNGEQGMDSLFGGTGNDLLVGGENKDCLSGGDGDDELQGEGTIADGEGGNDSLDGGAGADLLVGGEGDDQETGGSGDDSVSGDAGKDILDGGADNDQVYGGEGDDNASGGAGNDLVVGEAGDDKLFGNDGDDVINGNAGKDTIDGGAGADVITGDEGADSITGGADNDNIDAGADADNLDGGANDDLMHGGTGADSMHGSDGADVMFGDEDNDSMAGDAGNDSIEGGTGADQMSGGTGSDILRGQEENDNISGNEDGDAIFGDAGSDIAAGGTGDDEIHGGTEGDLLKGEADNDTVFGGTGDDSAVGGAGNDKILGEENDDDLIGGQTVAGGTDGDDIIDGGSGNDAITGDNTSIVRTGFGLPDPVIRALLSAALYNATGAANVGPARPNPNAAVRRDFAFYDHSISTAPGLYGNDNIAGGGGFDSIFGQLGNDFMQGDGAAMAAPASAPTDADDYMEGGGGNDVMYGNGGRDDIIGGSSSLFGLTTAAQRPDGSDTAFGGSGTDIARNTNGDTSGGGHARDADLIIGDNGNGYRILKSDLSGFATFNYDDYPGTTRIIPHAVDLLDYIPDDNAANDTGGGDVLHGEAGDDLIFGGSANDTALGEGQDDNMFGGTGDDWMSGGTGDDALLGDDGKILTSRNGKTEPLNGVNTATAQSTINNSSLNLTVTLNVTGALSKSVDLEPFDRGGADLLFGGLGNDSVHGGAGQDAISGAEALPAIYNSPGPSGLVFSGEKFAAFNYSSPFAKIAAHPLNFDAAESDGADKLFGDPGNDWIVAGTGRDNLYGGPGNDLLNADDILETSTADTPPLDGPDIAFGGGGRDILISNATTDRIVDWVGEFNNYYVPFSPFGQSTIIRQIGPNVPEFIYGLGKSDGADQTRIGAGLGTAARNGEPFGELAVVLPGDAGYKDQQGPPVGPQPQ